LDWTVRDTLCAQIAAPEPSLSLAGIAPAGVRVGYSLPLNWAPSTAERELFAANFDAAVPDNATKWNQIERNAEGLYEWAKADAFLADAASIGAAYKIWHLCSAGTFPYRRGCRPSSPIPQSPGRMRRMI
jgi:hypothetical protein